MKITKENYLIIKKIIINFVDKVGEKACIDHGYGCSQQRFVWDIFYYACRYDKTTISSFYDRGINDSHIETAVKKVFRELELL